MISGEGYTIPLWCGSEKNCLDEVCYQLYGFQFHYGAVLRSLAN